MPSPPASAPLLPSSDLTLGRTSCPDTPPCGAGKGLRRPRAAREGEKGKATSSSSLPGPPPSSSGNSQARLEPGSGPPEGMHSKIDVLTMFEWPTSPWQYIHHRFGMAGQGQADVLERVLAREPGVILNVGCGPQSRHVANLALLTPRLLALDHDLNMLTHARGGGTPRSVVLASADAYQLPLASGRCRHVLGLGLLRYITNVPELVAECTRVLIRGGTLTMTASARYDEGRLLSAAGGKGFEVEYRNVAYCEGDMSDMKARLMWILRYRG
jgi:SAM-dependent methyltransferase